MYIEFYVIFSGRRGLVNGTSDGEDNTPDSKKSSPALTPSRKQRTTAAAAKESPLGVSSIFTN